MHAPLAALSFTFYEELDPPGFYKNPTVTWLDLYIDLRYEVVTPPYEEDLGGRPT